MNNQQPAYKQRLAESVAFVLMNEFNEMVTRYPVAYIEAKSPKRESAVMKAADPLYPLHTAFTTSVNDYGNSVVLIGNELAIPFMAREAATFVFHLENFYAGIKKANNVQELQAYYKQFTLKPKQILDALVEDTKRYAEQFGFELDAKGVITVFKEHKASLTA